MMIPEHGQASLGDHVSKGITVAQSPQCKHDNLSATKHTRAYVLRWNEQPANQTASQPTHSSLPPSSFLLNAVGAGARLDGQMNGWDRMGWDRMGWNGMSMRRNEYAMG